VRNQTSAQSVLETSLNHLREATHGHLRARLGVPVELDWIPARTVLSEADHYLPELLGNLATSLGGDSPKVVASFFLKAWLRQIVLASAGCYLLDCVVPDVSIDNLSLRFAPDGRVDEIAFHTGRAVVLDKDDATTDILIERVATRNHLRARLRDILAYEHVAPVIKALRPHVPVGERFMWATTADTCIGMMLLAGKRMGNANHFRDEAEQFGLLEPLKGASGVIDVEYAGQVEPVLKRGCCCFAYHLDQYEHCKTCPLIPLDQRIANIQATMGQQ
jgi:ferric iron reductase protein FhuF